MKQKFLSLEWFKSKVNQAAETVIERRLDKILDKLEEEEEGEYPEESMDLMQDEYAPKYVFKAYTSLKLVGDTLNVVLNNGTILMKTGATEEDFHKIKAANCMQDVMDVINTPEVAAEKEEERKKEERIMALSKGTDLLLETGDFNIKDGSVFINGISRSLPQLLVEQFIEVVSTIEDRYEGRLAKHELGILLNEDDEYLSLKRFFMWCCLNPRAEVANDLYDFLARNSFRITKQGFFVALRNVVTVSDNGVNDTDLVKFISNAYNKIKAVWKKNPAGYLVVKTASGDYELEKIGLNGTIHTKIGILSELYLNLPNMKENRFTDAHTRTFDIRIGKVVNMPSEKCNWNRADCGHAGLHFTADEINYVGCGDTSVIVLINPMKVVGIGKAKGRCYEYLPIMAVPRDEVTQILHDGAFDTLQLDEDYVVRELESLQEKVQEGFTIETTKHQFNLPSISLSEIASIVKSLDSMKSVIERRVRSID
jgi:hypothetical protein